MIFIRRKIGHFQIFCWFLTSFYFICKTREGFFERCVMNNYFGIGIDAKISLDFHHKREEHPEKCRSRTRNFMWYGVLGSKQWYQVISSSILSKNFYIIVDSLWACNTYRKYSQFRVINDNSLKKMKLISCSESRFYALHRFLTELKNNFPTFGFLQKSCKNLEQRLQLECDGQRIPLPSLQGIVVLNIPR